MRKPENIITILDRLDAVEPTFCTQHGIALPVDKDDWERISKALRAGVEWLAARDFYEACDTQNRPRSNIMNAAISNNSAREAFRESIVGKP